MSKLKDEMILIGMWRSCVHIEYKDHNFCPKGANYVSPTWGWRDWELSDEDSLRVAMQKEKHRLN